MAENVNEQTGYHTISADEATTLNQHLPEREQIDALTDHFKLLNEESRLKILLLLHERELCVHDLTALLDMNQPAVSHQLSELRNRGIIARRKEGRVVYYSPDDHELNDFLNQIMAWFLDR